MSTSGPRLDLIEYESTVCSDPWIEQVPRDFWRQLGVTVTRSVGDTAWTIRADKFSGMARTSLDREASLSVSLAPKIQGCDHAFLADYAYGQRGRSLRQIDSSHVDVQVLNQDPAACLLVWYVAAVKNFAVRHLRRDYRSENLILHGEIRGTLLLDRYIQEHMAQADPIHVPCRISQRTQDTPNNRVLKAGLRRVAELARTLRVSGARRVVLREVGAAMPFFAGVADINVRASDRRAVVARGPFRHYKGILGTTLDLLDGNYFTSEQGDRSVDAFLWEMPVLFQEALRGILEDGPAWTLDAKRTTAAITSGSPGHQPLVRSKVDPDYVLHTNHGALLLDAKYKSALRPPDPSSDDEEDLVVSESAARKVRIKRSDIYQMVAYRRHRRWAGAPGALIYPISLSPGESYQAPYGITGFDDPIHIVFLDVGPNARNNLSAFYSTIEALKPEQGHSQPRLDPSSTHGLHLSTKALQPVGNSA